MHVARLAIAFDLPDVAADHFPASDLAGVLAGDAPAPIVTAVPLKPAARIVAKNPALVAPHRQRLAGIDAEIVERLVAVFPGEPGVRKPALRKFLAAVGHVLAAEHAEAKHFRRR